MGRNKAIGYADNPSVGEVARRASLDSATSNASWHSSKSQDPQPSASKDGTANALETYLDDFLADKERPKGPLPAFKKGDDNSEYAQALMDYMYNAVEVPKDTQKGQSIVVYSQERAGLGDIYFGAKVANLLKHNLRHCDVHCVIRLNSPDSFLPDSLKTEYFSAPLGASGKFTVAAIRGNVSAEAGSSAPTVVVSGPAGKLREMGGLGLGQPPVILAPEYGMRAKHAKPELPPEWRFAPSGAGEDEYGLVLERTFLSGKKLDLKTYNPALAARVQTGNYYFAYVNGYAPIMKPSNTTGDNQSHLHALQVVRRYKEGKSNLPNTIVFAGGKTQREKLENALTGFEDHGFDNLSDGGSGSAKTGKSMYVYFQNMTHQQFLSALQNSHRIRFVTGDQSLSEALSLSGSFIIYEKLQHKPRAYTDIMSHFPGLTALDLTEDTASAQMMVEIGLGQDKKPAFDKVHDRLNFQHRIVGAVKGYVLRRNSNKLTAIDRTVSDLARKGGAADAIANKLKSLGQELLGL